ncbi:MAG: hypothetical protein C4340_03215 [Armatimonadota bacterium]
MSTIVGRDGKIRQLDRRAEPSELVTREQVMDPARLVRIVMDILRDVARFKRRWHPRRIDFEDVVVDSTGRPFRLPHGFGGRVRWWVVDWRSTAGNAPKIETAKDADGKPLSDDRTLVLRSLADGTATIRVEEAG